MSFCYQYSIALKGYILEIINKHRDLTIIPKGKIKHSDPVHCVWRLLFQFGWSRPLYTHTYFFTVAFRGPTSSELLYMRPRSHKKDSGKSSPSERGKKTLTTKKNFTCYWGLKQTSKQKNGHYGLVLGTKRRIKGIRVKVRGPHHTGRNLGFMPFQWETVEGFQPWINVTVWKITPATL